jgi:hypothetical protein
MAIFGLVAVPIFVRYSSAAWERQLDSWRSMAWAQPLLAAAARPPGSPRALSVLNAVLLAVVCLAALVKISLPLSPAAMERATRSSLPVDAVTYIETQRPAGPMFNSYNWGGYLLFRLWPDYRVFVDGRTDLYDDTFLREYLHIYRADDGWSDLLDKYNVRMVVVEADSVLARFLRRDPAWKTAYHDSMASIFVKAADLAER